jgi:hypothetical protein
VFFVSHPMPRNSRDPRVDVRRYDGPQVYIPGPLRALETESLEIIARLAA